MKFFRHEHCSTCEYIENTLVQMCLAHNTYSVHDEGVCPVKGQEKNNTKAPLLIDEGKTFQGTKEILDYLESLKNFKAQWELFQSDVCYYDSDSNSE